MENFMDPFFYKGNFIYQGIDYNICISDICKDFTCTREEKNIVYHYADDEFSSDGLKKHEDFCFLFNDEYDFLGITRTGYSEREDGQPWCSLWHAEHAVDTGKDIFFDGKGGVTFHIKDEYGNSVPVHIIEKETK